MSDLKGTNIAAPVVPFTDQDIYPTHDSLYGRGGWREVDTIEERDAIPAARLRNGCVCYVGETELPYLYKDGEWTELAVGSGGASGGITMKLYSIVGAMLSAIAGEEARIGFTFTSVYTDDNMPTGQGVAVYKVNSLSVATRVIEQGNTYFDVSPYLAKGENEVNVTVTDSTGSSRSLSYKVDIIELTISSTFDDTRDFEGAITYTYTPMGALLKDIHFVLDGKEIGVAKGIEYSGRQLSYSIPAQKHGSHTLNVFITAVHNGMEVKSNELFYDLICIETGNATPIIACPFYQNESQQYATLNIPYRVYDPLNTQANVTLSAAGTALSQLQVDRTRQTWNYRITQSGSLVLSISCGDVVKKINLSVTQSAITSEAVKEDLELFLTAQGRKERQKWEYKNVSAQLSGFNWATNGWVSDGTGSTCLRVSGGAKVSIPFHIFANDFRITGKTIELEFSTREVEDYDAVVIESFQENRGLYITAQNTFFSAESTTIETQFKEEERVRISFVIEEVTAKRMIYTYINGIISGVIQYPDDEKFMQLTPVGITIGNPKCVVDIYNIRVYANNLNPHQMLDNYIADMDDVEKKLYLFNKNQVYNAYGDIALPLVLEQIPGLVITGELPPKKGEKKIVSVSYTNLQDPSKSFTATGVEIDVQGTSSQAYPRKNYKMKFKSGFTLTSTGEQVAKYAHTDTAIPVNCFTFKADFAESSGTHNTGLANYIEWLLKEMKMLTPPQESNSSVRTTVEGFPMTIFHRQTETDTITFLGKYNFNNDKSTMETFGFISGCECWEFCNNNSDRVKFKISEYTRLNQKGEIEWLNDFEGRYPDGSTDYTNLKRVTDWVASTYGNSTKFKEEVTHYFDLDNLIFYYLITEALGMVDQRAKNMFLTTFDCTKWMFIFMTMTPVLESTTWEKLFSIII